ncbi:MAG: SUMF1/EgtB/PvdO family nonheme iron enzyme [Bacteroidota bacterium]
MRGKFDGQYYDDQAGAWQALALSECATENDWYQYYKAADYANKFGTGSYDVDQIVELASAQLNPDGFALNYLRFSRVFGTEEGWPLLLAAHAAEPDRYEAFPALITYFTLEGNQERVSELLDGMHQKEPIPHGVMDYNYNQIIGCPSGAILLTAGDADTYPSWWLQAVENIRPDVMVLSVPLFLSFPEYKARMLGQLNLETSIVPTISLAKELVEALSNTGRPIMVSATSNRLLAELPSEQLFVMGLAFQYGKEPIDNLAHLQNLYTDDWRTDQLFTPLGNDAGQRVADQLNANYIPALLALYQHYAEVGHPQTTKLASAVQSLATRLSLQEAVSTYFDNDLEVIPQLASGEPGIKAKKIEKQYKYIPNGTLKLDMDDDPKTVRGFFMSETEVSNAEYQLFLEDLLRQRLFEYLDSSAVNEVNWIEYVPEELRGEYQEIISRFGDPVGSENPVVNMTRRGAELYAIWLAQAFNSDPKRAGEKKVRFRLPTKEEWQYAAMGGKNHAIYPWGGRYFRNRQGCYLANFNTLLDDGNTEYNYSSTQAPEESVSKKQLDIMSKSNGCPDGAWLTTKVDSYFPNDYGLYNMSGNAAELISEPGKTMGGSWLDASYYMQIGSENKQEASHQSVGFRLIMEYVD